MVQKKSSTFLIKDLSKDAEKYLERRDYLKVYEIQEKILQNLVREYKDHNKYEAVELKAKLLNMFYSTGIQAINSVVEKIMSIKNIDEILNGKKHSKELIDIIAELNLSNGNTRNNYSFATKYCALHQPKKYPIYDSIVAAIFISLLKQGKLPPYQLKKGKSEISTAINMTVGEFTANLRDYNFFVEVYNCFMSAYGLNSLSYRQVDRYLWGSYKVKDKQYEIEKITNIPSSKYFEYKDKEIKKTITIKE